MTTKIIPSNISDLSDEKAAADFLGVATGTLSVWRSTGRYNLPFIKSGAQRCAIAKAICWHGWNGAPVKRRDRLSQWNFRQEKAACTRPEISPRQRCNAMIARILFHPYIADLLTLAAWCC